jgi:hypothetical protein
MPVTDLSGGLPWWASQGGPQGGPAATPQGGGAAAAPAGGAPPGSNATDWLAYLQQMFGISPAQADQLMSSLSAQGGQPSYPPGAVSALNAGGTPPVNNAIPTGGVPPMPPRPQPGPAPIATPNQPYGGPLAAADAASAPRGGAYGNMPFPGQQDPTGFWGPRPGAGGPPQSSAPPGPLATGGASGSGAMSNPRFITDARPNMAAERGGQSRGGPPMMGMMNLAGMFGPLAARRRG